MSRIGDAPTGAANGTSWRWLIEGNTYGQGTAIAGWGDPTHSARFPETGRAGVCSCSNFLCRAHLSRDVSAPFLNTTHSRPRRNIPACSIQQWKAELPREAAANSSIETGARVTSCQCRPSAPRRPVLFRIERPYRHPNSRQSRMDDRCRAGMCISQSHWSVNCRAPLVIAGLLSWNRR